MIIFRRRSPATLCALNAPALRATDVVLIVREWLTEFVEADDVQSSDMCTPPE